MQMKLLPSVHLPPLYPNLCILLVQPDNAHICFQSSYNGDRTSSCPKNNTCPSYAMGPLTFSLVCLHLHLSHLADALIQSDLQIGAFTLRHPVEQPLYNSASKSFKGGG